MKIQILLSTLIYIISCVVTYFFYPAGPIHDLETDKVIGQTYGLTKWHIIVLFIFSSINNFTFANINRSNSIGVRPEYYADIFILNNLIMVLYSFYSKALYLYAIIPIYAIWKIFWLARKFCCPPKQNVAEEPEQVSNR